MLLDEHMKCMSPSGSNLGPQELFLFLFFIFLSVESSFTLSVIQKEKMVEVICSTYKVHQYKGWCLWLPDTNLFNDLFKCLRSEKFKGK